MSTHLRGRTVFITGASRGVGRAIALRAAQDGANVVITGKSDTPDPRLPGTIHTVAEEVATAGGEPLALPLDVRDAEAVEAAMQTTVERFGGLDVLVNNAGAIHLAGTLETPVKRFDLMHQVNARAAFVCSQAAIPHLKQSPNPHVVSLAPPPDLSPRWLAGHAAYTLSKYGMSLLMMGMAEEFRESGIAFNALWPRTLIDTAAVRNLLGGEGVARRGRHPAIVADAWHELVTTPSTQRSGACLIDEHLLHEQGVTDFSAYRVDPDLSDADLYPDLFIDGHQG